jgi:hypothetical protein
VVGAGQTTGDTMGTGAPRRSSSPATESGLSRWIRHLAWADELPTWPLGGFVPRRSEPRQFSHIDFKNARELDAMTHGFNRHSIGRPN